MKRLICVKTAAVFLAAVFLAAACAAGPAVAAGGNLRNDGIYEGTSMGWRGPIQVEVRIASGGITDIIILEHDEDPFIGGQAMQELLELVLENQSTDVDAVSGATESSKGFLEAVEYAIIIP
jgi:uncharacterized protein with FMN-binding domain